MIILISDGQGYVSDSVLEKAKAEGIKIYTVGLGPLEDGTSAAKTLKKIASSTEGQFFRASTADDFIKKYNRQGRFFFDYFTIISTIRNRPYWLSRGEFYA